MPPKKITALGAALQPLDTNQETLSLREARRQKRKATSPTLLEEELDHEIRNMEIIHQQVQRKRRRWLGWPTFKGRSMKPLRKCVILLKMIMTEGPNIGSFVKRAHSTKTNGTMILIMVPLLLMMLLPLAAELQAIPWPQSYKPPQLPMYDGHSDPKQFLMSYEATISSYGGNTAVMAKSFVMAVRNVAQTWYSSLRPGTITSWQKLKDMLVTSFQGFQMKPVIAQSLFQCTQDHEEYLQAYVRRFLRLRAQAPTMPNEIVIEAMINGLRPGPMA
jgi:hypothetical protein